MGLHERAQLVYSSSILTLGKEDHNTSEEEADTAGVEAAFPLLMAWLHGRPDFNPGMIDEPEVRDFIRATTNVLDKAVDYAIRERPMSDVSVQRLKESNYVFSGIKTFHELNEALPSLIDEFGKIKSFEQFLNDVQKVNESYNRYYLKAEYNFAKASAGMAAKWQGWWNDENRGRYLLQYRTAGDERVRRSHRLMHDITLPITSHFWDWYFPPNGWNCRCTVIQVRKGKYPESNEREAMNAASQATAGKHQEMMRFNPGKQMTTFPAYNAYTMRKCTECPNNGALKLAAKIPDNELCRACRVVRELQTQKEELKDQRRTLREWAKENLIGKTTLVSGVPYPVEFTMNGVKETLNQPHKRTFAKNRALQHIVKLLKEGEYIKEGAEEKGNPMIRKYHYVKIEIEKEDSYAIIRELTDGKAQFYSIVEKLRE